MSHENFPRELLNRPVSERLAYFRSYTVAHPLLKEAGVIPEKFHVVFLADAPMPDAIKKLEALTLPPDKVRHKGKEIYFYFPNGVSGSSIWKHNLDRVLGTSGTMRNWKTVNIVYQMATECE